MRFDNAGNLQSRCYGWESVFDWLAHGLPIAVLFELAVFFVFCHLPKSTSCQHHDLPETSRNRFVLIDMDHRSLLTCALE